MANLPGFIDFDLALLVYLLYSVGAACPLLTWYTGEFSLSYNSVLFLCL